MSGRDPKEASAGAEAQRRESLERGEAFLEGATAPSGNVSPTLDRLRQAPGDREADARAAVERIMAELVLTPVSGALDLTSRLYRRKLEEASEGEQATHGAGYAYMAERASALADLFRDLRDPSRCILDGRAGAVDLVRGFRVLARVHPREEAREMYASFGNAVCLALSARVGGVPFDVDPTLETPDGARATLRIWYEQVVRASRAAAQIRASRGVATSASGLVLAGRQGAVRAELVVQFQMQGMGELGLLVDHVGLSLSDPSPETSRPDVGAS